MSKQQIYDFLNEFDLCSVCILRYLNGRCIEFENVEKAYQDRQLELPSTGNEDPEAKRAKPNVCNACLGIFQNDTVATVVTEILEKSNLNSFECDLMHTSVSVPIMVQIRELSIWIALLRQFPETFSETQMPGITSKEVLKYLVNLQLCKATDRKIDQNQTGILVNLFFDHENEAEELERLKLVYPKSLDETFRHKKKSQRIMTRNAFDKHFYPENLSIDDCFKSLPIPPKTVSSPIKLTNYTIDGPTIFVAGRYRKLSRALSQSPWILESKRMMADSVQEIIAHEVTSYFGIDSVNEAKQLNFMASGREDIDVRCLGNGRPFVLEINSSKKSTLPVKVAAEMELAVDKSKKVSVQNLQLVPREELVHIKTGEEHKKKIYTALCILQHPATKETMQKLQIPEGFLCQQKTPLRVLHRRPHLTRPRQIYSVRGRIHKDNPKVVILDVVTQAGTYVKELVHGEFGRTSPSICSIIGQEIDIAALDVKAIELEWPPLIDNRAVLNES